MEMERNCRENSRSVSFSKIIAPASENDQLIMLVIVMIMVIMLMIVMIILFSTAGVYRFSHCYYHPAVEE